MINCLLLFRLFFLIVMEQFDRLRYFFFFFLGGKERRKKTKNFTLLRKSEHYQKVLEISINLSWFDNNLIGSINQHQSTTITYYPNDTIFITQLIKDSPRFSLWLFFPPCVCKPILKWEKRREGTESSKPFFFASLYLFRIEQLKNFKSIIWVGVIADNVYFYMRILDYGYG